jgi:hypothetical protein
MKALTDILNRNPLCTKFDTAAIDGGLSSDQILGTTRINLTT